LFNTIITGITSLLTDISSEMVYPLTPLFLASLGAPPAALGLIEGFAESAASLLKVLSGWFSDRLGRRKPVAIAGYAGAGLGKILLWFAAAWGMVFAGRMVDRIGKGIRTAPRDALIADSTAAGKRGRAFGLHRALDTLGAAAGVAIAMLLMARFPANPGPSAFRSVFLLSLIPAGLGVLVLLFARDRARASGHKDRPRLSWRSLPARLRWFLVIVGLFALGNSSNMFLLLRARDIGFAPVAVLGLYLAYNVVYGLLSWPAGRLSDHVGRKKLLVAGYIVYGLVYVGFALFTGPALAWALFGCYGAYSALTEGLEKALVADIAPQAHRATFIGLHSTLVGIGLLPASLIAGGLWTWLGPGAPFWFGGGLGLLAAIGLLIVL